MPSLLLGLVWYLQLPEEISLWENHTDLLENRCLQLSAACLAELLLFEQVDLLDGVEHMRIPAGQTYKSPGRMFVEGDASAASYWLAGELSSPPLALLMGKLPLDILQSCSIQGGLGLIWLANGKMSTMQPTKGMAMYHYGPNLSEC